MHGQRDSCRPETCASDSQVIQDWFARIRSASRHVLKNKNIYTNFPGKWTKKPSFLSPIMGEDEVYDEDDDLAYDFESLVI